MYENGLRERSGFVGGAKKPAEAQQGLGGEGIRSGFRILRVELYHVNGEIIFAEHILGVSDIEVGYLYI